MQNCLGIYIENNLIKYAKVSKDKNDFKVEAFGIRFFENLNETIKKVVEETYSFNTPISINIENPSDLNGTTAGRKALIEIGGYLWYDSTTRIVYWWNGYFGSSKYATTPTAYYAPNGMPYKYNPSTNSLEEIK